jgi:hypothetical protein
VCVITESSNCLGSILSSVIELLGCKVDGHRTSDVRSWAFGRAVDTCLCVPVCIYNQTRRSHKRGSRRVSLHMHVQAHYVFMLCICLCVPVCIYNQTRRSHKRGSRRVSLYMHVQAQSFNMPCICLGVPVCIYNQTRRSHKRGSRRVSLHMHVQAHYIFNI